MASRRAAVLAPLLVLSSVPAAAAADPVEPRAGVLLTGQIQFPRPQRMSIQTDGKDGTKLTVAMGFDGRCKGGGLGEAWAGNVKSAPVIRALDGRISATLTGTFRNLGGVTGRTGTFKWQLTGRFTDRDVVSATVDGSAEVRMDGKLISRCKIASPASVRLAVRSS